MKFYQDYLLGIHVTALFKNYLWGTGLSVLSSCSSHSKTWDHQESYYSHCFSEEQWEMKGLICVQRYTDATWWAEIKLRTLATYLPKPPSPAL